MVDASLYNVLAYSVASRPRSCVSNSFGLGRITVMSGTFGEGHVLCRNSVNHRVLFVPTECFPHPSPSAVFTPANTPVAQKLQLDYGGVYETRWLGNNVFVFFAAAAFGVRCDDDVPKE